MKTSRHIVSCAGALAFAGVTALASTSQAQVQTLRGTGPITEKPPGVLATIARRDPDFSKIRFLGMQRDYRDELRGLLLIGNEAIRFGRPVAPMQPIVWPPEPSQ